MLTERVSRAVPCPYQGEDGSAPRSQRRAYGPPAGLPLPVRRSRRRPLAGAGGPAVSPDRLPGPAGRRLRRGRPQRGRDRGLVDRAARRRRRRAAARPPLAPRLDRARDPRRVRPVDRARDLVVGERRAQRRRARPRSDADRAVFVADALGPGPRRPAADGRRRRRRGRAGRRGRAALALRSRPGSRTSRRRSSSPRPRPACTTRSTTGTASRRSSRSGSRCCWRSQRARVTRSAARSRRRPSRPSA